VPSAALRTVTVGPCGPADASLSVASIAATDRILVGASSRKVEPFRKINAARSDWGGTLETCGTLTESDSLDDL
jgi:hypothetical protein